MCRPAPFARFGQPQTPSWAAARGQRRQPSSKHRELITGQPGRGTYVAEQAAR
ncbi:hypothetical protein ACIA47_13505 [Micromonospora sp. NPDC051227]|uniref:hypothetical protein n=1 Tax=Micromonospora sp. NPDC051227 TaxID=3364285 RepID=UPI0037961B05